LQSSCHVHAVSVHVGAVHYYITNVDADAEPDAAVGSPIAIMRGDLLLDLHGTAHGTIDAIKHYKKRVTCGVHDPPAMLRDRWVDQILAQLPNPFECADIVPADQTAVAHDVRVHDGNQLSLTC
jgi:hypothetical protein